MPWHLQYTYLLPLSSSLSSVSIDRYLLPERHPGAKQKTPVMKNDKSPRWNHLLVFDDVSLEDLEARSLELTVWGHDRFTTNDFLGGVRLNTGSGGWWIVDSSVGSKWVM